LFKIYLFCRYFFNPLLFIQPQKHTEVKKMRFWISLGSQVSDRRKGAADVCVTIPTLGDHRGGNVCFRGIMQYGWGDFSKRLFKETGSPGRAEFRLK
jgi:hypothetical protein